MSYLLKALEKAELERKQNNVSPDITTSTVVVSKGLPTPVIAILLAAALLLFWKLIPEAESTSGVEHTVLVEAQKTGRSALKPESEASRAVIANELIQPEVAGTALQQELAGSEVVTPPQNEVKQLEQLSKAVLEIIPSLQLESHIYSSAESYRSVVINGRSFKQGQFITQDVILEKITEDGIVIEVASQLIALPKGISWVASNAQ